MPTGSLTVSLRKCSSCFLGAYGLIVETPDKRTTANYADRQIVKWGGNTATRHPKSQNLVLASTPPMWTWTNSCTFLSLDAILIEKEGLMVLTFLQWILEQIGDRQECFLKECILQRRCGKSELMEWGDLSLYQERRSNQPQSLAKSIKFRRGVRKVSKWHRGLSCQIKRGSSEGSPEGELGRKRWLELTHPWIWPQPHHHYNDTLQHSSKRARPAPHLDRNLPEPSNNFLCDSLNTEQHSND